MVKEDGRQSTPTPKVKYFHTRLKVHGLAKPFRQPERVCAAAGSLASPSASALEAARSPAAIALSDPAARLSWRVKHPRSADMVIRPLSSPGSPQRTIWLTVFLLQARDNRIAGADDPGPPRRLRLTGAYYRALWLPKGLRRSFMRSLWMLLLLARIDPLSRLIVLPFNSLT